MTTAAGAAAAAAAQTPTGHARRNQSESVTALQAEHIACAD